MIHFAATAGFLLLAASATEGEVRTPPRPITTALVAEPVGRGGRTPIGTDGVEHALVMGTWGTPAEGDRIQAPEGVQERAWRRIEAGANGVLEDAALRGGYALTVVESAAERVALLDARGHRHVVVNGEPRVGDVYETGSVRLPVLLRAGRNELLFRGGRGRLAASIAEPPAPVFLESRDQTLPDVLVNHPGPLHAGIVVTNATNSWQRGLTIVASAPGAPPVTTAVPPLPPLSVRKAAVQVLATAEPASPEQAGSTVAVGLELRDAAGARLHGETVTLTVRNPTERHVRTFVSEIDGSVQYFAVTPARGAGEGSGRPALVLSLHGASVEATSQAAAYEHKDWAHIVCPTNRRPFGFDWEDWGRLDAMEVLALAEGIFLTDPRRTYLTGHSMGGHGTWQIGAHFPGRFAAIAPSAGWPDFWSYGGAGDWPNPSPVEALLARSMNASRTLSLERNYQHGGVYVLHGDADETVGVRHARTMRRRLAEFHTNWAYYERPGGGHWWGNACVDWGPLFDFLRQNVRPEEHQVRRVQFSTVNPGISARCAWATVESQLHPMEISTVDVSIDPGARTINATTINIHRLALDLSPFAAQEKLLPPGDPLTVTIDGQALGAVAWPDGGAGGGVPAVLRLVREGEGAWSAGAPAAPASHKGPHRAGPLKDAFRRRVLFVVGTTGTAEENAWSLAKARYDAETFWYRGNGSVDILPDSEFEPAAHPNRSVVVYGNADTNGAWGKLLSGAPFEVRRGSARVGDVTVSGEDLAALLTYPRSDSESAYVAVVGGTGMAGFRATNQLPYFVSGVAYPDWTLLGAEVYMTGTKGVRGLGFFGPEWAYAAGESAWDLPVPPPSPAPPPPAAPEPSPELVAEQAEPAAEPVAAPEPAEPSPGAQPPAPQAPPG